MGFIKNLFSKINSYKNQKILFENFYALSFLQLTDYILPLLTLPYLVRVLGPEKFGLIAFVGAFVQYFVILTEYGFNLSATRNISIYREDRKKVSQIFSCVMLIKLSIMVFSFFILMALVLLVPRFKSDWLVYLFTFGTVVGNAFFPVWFFQGMERMKFITFLNLFAKLIFVSAIFIFVKSQADYIYVPLINSLGFIISGVLSLFIVWQRFSIKLSFPSLNDVICELKEGWHIFISTVVISLYTVSNTFILGFLTNNSIVGYYATIEKLIRAVQGLLTPISQSVYPHINKLAIESKEAALNFIEKLAISAGSIFFIVSLIIFIFARPIVGILLGAQYQESIIVLKILAFLPFIISLSNILGIQTMLTFDLKKIFSNIIILAGFLNIFLALILIPLYKHIGASSSVLATEIFVTVAMFIYLMRNDILKFKFLLKEK